MNSCRLFGGGKYASQTEVQTDVPESFEHGRPSAEPPTAKTASSPIANGVPVTSNLIDSSSSDTIPSPGELSRSSGSTASSTVTGGPALPSSDASRSLIDIPKPDFASISVHTPRAPAQMLSLEKPEKPIPRLSAPISSTPYTGIAKETVRPAAPAPIAAKPEIALAPRPAPAVETTPPEPGVPLLHSGARLSDFYAELHQPLLNHPVVENTSLPTDPIVEVTPEPAAIANSSDPIPPPPSGGVGNLAAPRPQ